MRCYTSQMTITAYVHDHAVALPEDVVIAEGTPVQIVLPDQEDLEEKRRKLTEWMERVRGTATSGLTTEEVMRMTRGED
jgi:hypothetical protein